MKIKTVKNYICFVLCFVLLIGISGANFLAESGSNQEQNDIEDNLSKEIITEIPKNEEIYSFPSGMRGVRITPEKDFAFEGKTGEERTAEVNQVLDNVEKLMLNTIIVDTSSQDKVYYGTGTNLTVDEDPVSFLVEKARERNIFVYLTYDIDTILKSSYYTDFADNVNYLVIHTNMFASRYSINGVILDGYYSEKSVPSYEDYMYNGSGIGFENWLLDKSEYIFSLVSETIHSTSNTIAVGISIDDVWLNQSDEFPDGSPTNASFQALKDGFADTAGYINDGMVDFVLVNTNSSRSDENIPFEEYTDWWATNSAKADIPFYVGLSNQFSESGNKGWTSFDELVKQVIYSNKNEICNGNVFLSYTDFVKDCASNKAVIDYYNENIDEDELAKDLKMIMPKQLVFTTAEPTVKFMGCFDRNFDLTINDEKVELTEEGDFLLEKELDIGANTFVIKNKGKEYVYKITREQKILKVGTLEPSVDMVIDGGISLDISVQAYRGSLVSATINGRTIGLTEIDGMTDVTDTNSVYTLFKGRYNMPEGVVGVEQDLGRISVYASYNGLGQSLIGGRIKVSAEEEVIEQTPVPTEEPDTPSDSTETDAPLPNIPDNVTMIKTGMTPVSGNSVMISRDNTTVFSPKTTGKAASPEYSKMVYGVKDFISKKVTYTFGTYYILKSGRRILTSSAISSDTNTITTNNLVALDTYTKNGDTILRFMQDIKTPYNITYSPITYTSNANGDYLVNDFSPTQIHITFDYISAMGGDLSFGNSSLFKDSKWSVITVDGQKKARLTLSLRKAGIYSGVWASYDSEGNLVLKFNGYENSLAGMVVVIDPGHGYTSEGVFDPGAIGNFQSSYGVFFKEQTVNYNLSLKIEEKLTSLGAKVIRFDSERNVYDTFQRATIARQYNPDIFISLHADAAGTSSAIGNSAYYFTPFSRNLANDIALSVGNYYSQNLYYGASKTRGAHYDYFSVTLDQSFPSVLLEMGFISNYAEAKFMNTEVHQDGLVDAIIDGIKKYLSRK